MAELNMTNPSKELNFDSNNIPELSNLEHAKHWTWSCLKKLENRGVASLIKIRGLSVSF